jgi:E3 ubiquitin-protein ligase AIP2
VPFFEGQLGLSGAAEGAHAAAPSDASASALAALFGAHLHDDALEAALAASLADAPPPRAPPAGLAAVRALSRETLTEEALAALGDGAQCSVCREELRVGDTAQRMPCSAAHVFHPACLAPWLAEHASCPVCRAELPTDDWRHEERKAKEIERAADAKGAANALKGGEFMWL